MANYHVIYCAAKGAICAAGSSSRRQRLHIQDGGIEQGDVRIVLQKDCVLTDSNPMKVCSPLSWTGAGAQHERVVP